jgi:alpha-tubulin suppressor-like RCC1 family protein
LGDTNDRGDNPGEMGDNLPVVDLGTGKTAVKLAVGNAHACARLNDNSLKCWGYGSFAQLGTGDTMTRGDNPGEMGNNLPVVNLGTGKTTMAFFLGSAHTCAILNDGTVKCWGYNYEGQLGQGDQNNRGDNPGEMGDNLPAVSLF